MSGFLVPGQLGPVAMAAASAAAAVDWWLANNTIALANVLEHVENPTARQLYAGAGEPGAWSVSFRTNLVSLLTANYAFDVETGRVGIGFASAGAINGLVLLISHNIGLFATGDHSYMICSDGTNVQCYRDNSAIGVAIASANDIGGVVRWRSRFADITGDWYEWPVALRAGHVANVALGATQRAALHAAMMALA